MTELTVIVPTMNESGNIAPLVARLAATLRGHDAEILFVDDSTDDTVATITQVASSAPLPVHVIARPLAERDGLSGAVVKGLQSTTADWVCVMDGDLQHPPEIVPLLLERGQVSSAEIVVASRQANRLGPVGLTRTRSLISNLLTLFARSLFPRSLKDVSDPLTGFFLIKRDAIDIAQLRPDGFKILLEILVRHPGLRASELFFDFALRHAGDSKADLREGMRFFRHVLKLRTSVHTRPLARLLAISGSALGISVTALSWMLEKQRSPLASAWLATLLGDSWRWIGRRQFVLPKHERAYHLGNRFWLASGGFTSFVMLPVLWLLTRFGRISTTPAYLLSLGVSGFVRYMLSDRWVWSSGLVGTEVTHAVYNIHNKVIIHSPVSIPDLAWFQSATNDDEPTIVIRVDRHGTPRQFENTVSFDDHLGRFGFGFTIVPDSMPVEVIISPLIGKAPHVLFVNILEPLMRYLLLRQGDLLLTAGAVTTPAGDATLVSASGRYGSANATLKQLAQRPEALYLAHEKVILSDDGRVFNLPLPATTTKLLNMTITRRIGAMLRRVEQFPAATVNAWVQRLFPPVQEPIVQRLGRDRIADNGRLAEVVLVAEGGMDSAENTTNSLLQNATDPFAFPLYDMLLSYDKQRDAQSNLPQLEQSRLTKIIQKLTSK